MSSPVSYTIEGNIGVISVNNPPVNALSQHVRQGLLDCFTEADKDDTVATILICDGRTFIAGADITEFGKPFQPPGLHETMENMENLSKPAIAAIHGTALGGGLETALCCHYRVAVPSARVGLPEVNLGVLPGTGGTQRLSRIVGKSRSIQMMVSGDLMSFEDAKDIGLVNEIFDKDTYWDDVIAFAKQFTPPNKAAKAVGHIKRAVCSGVEVPFESGLAIERELQQLLFQSQDATEGLAAYVEKRSAEFKGA